MIALPTRFPSIFPGKNWLSTTQSNQPTFLATPQTTPAGEGPVTVNSDDPPLFNTDLCREYEALAREFAYSPEALARIARNAFVVGGAEAELKAQLLQTFDRWAAGADLPEA